jgi:hypothetical protein
LVLTKLKLFLPLTFVSTTWCMPVDAFSGTLKHNSKIKETLKFATPNITTVKKRGLSGGKSHTPTGNTETQHRSDQCTIVIRRDRKKYILCNHHTWDIRSNQDANGNFFKKMTSSSRPLKEAKLVCHLKTLKLAKYYIKLWTPFDITPKSIYLFSFIPYVLYKSLIYIVKYNTFVSSDTWWMIFQW